MRDLTEEELKLAPDWATHYQILDLSTKYKLDFVSKSEFCHLNNQNELTEVMSHIAGITPEDIEIPRDKKPFDITKHEFGDTVQHMESDGCELSLYCVDGFRHVELYKDDAIAIAKALGVTAEDLK